MSSADHPDSDLIEKYLSGTASEGQVARFEALMREDPAFRELFEGAEARLSQEYEALEPVEPPAELLDDLMHQIDPSLEATVTQLTPKVQSEPWRMISIVSSLAAAVAIGFHLLPATPSDDFGEQIRAVVFLEGDGGNGTVIALRDDRSKQLLARISGVELGENQVQELWLVREGAETPISLGLLPRTSDDGSLLMTIDHEVSPGQDTLAISIEPLGGSPLDGPSGPVILAGIVQAV